VTEALLPASLSVTSWDKPKSLSAVTRTCILDLVFGHILCQSSQLSAVIRSCMLGSAQATFFVSE